MGTEDQDRGSREVTLREVFTPLLAYILLVTRPSAGRERTSSEIRSAIDRFLREQQELVKRHDLSVAEYENARFAVIAWADEVLIRYATTRKNLELYEAWQRAPLQVQIDATANAGVEFFDRLNRLDTGQKDVREIYYLCLSLGFRGSHYNDSPETLLEFRRKYSQAIPVAPADMFELERKREHITPQPYEIQPPPNRPRPKPVSLLWPGVAAVLLATILLYVFWPSPPCGNGVLDPGEQCDIALAGQCPGGLPCQANCTCTPIPQPDMAEINKIVQGLKCAQVSARNDNGVITLEGHIQSEAHRQQVLQAIRSVANVKDARGNLTILDWPFCRVLEVLAPVRTQMGNAGASLTINPQRGCEQVYHNNEDFIFQVTSPKEFQYVYVDYYSADKTGPAHVAPNKRTSRGNFYPQATSLTIQDKWSVSPPFGRELMTVITSPQPLFPTQREDIEKDTDGYLNELEQKLQTSPTDVSAAFCFITSGE
jgi:type VI secretion system protein ImpK